MIDTIPQASALLFKLRTLPSNYFAPHQRTYCGDEIYTHYYQGRSAGGDIHILGGLQLKLAKFSLGDATPASLDISFCLLAKASHLPSMYLEQYLPPFKALWRSPTKQIVQFESPSVPFSITTPPTDEPKPKAVQAEYQKAIDLMDEIRSEFPICRLKVVTNLPENNPEASY